jgi:site-specific recombinase XerD
MSKPPPEGPAPRALPGNGIYSKENAVPPGSSDDGQADLDHGQGGVWPEGLESELRMALEDFIESKVAPRTRVEYKIALRDFLAATGLRTLEELVALKAAQIVRYRNGLQERGLSPATVNLRLAALRGLFRRWLKLGKVQGNPADPELVEGLPVSDESRTQGLTLEEVDAIIGTCDGTLRGLRDRALLMALYFEGLRRSEASRLRYRDITTKRGLVEVRNSKNNPYATIRLRPEVKRAIDDYLEVLNRDLHKRETRPEDPVFCSLSKLRSFGKRLSPSAINDIVKKRVKDAGIKDKRITAHSWRHYVAKCIMSRDFALDLLQLFVSAGGSTSPLAKQVRSVLGPWFGEKHPESASTSRARAVS